MSPKSIILIEDDINLRQSIALILERAGYLVTATDCVYKALEFLLHAHYHLVISDGNIDNTKSVLLPSVLRLYPHLPIMVLTDQSSVECECEFKLVLANCLVKPVAPEKLLDFLSAILEKENNSNHIENNYISVDQP